ncbi:hypothetical protein Goari_014990, partial [Gossypium aridum]|nr:hypothetical protein [Gossypium aridum]
WTGDWILGYNHYLEECSVFELELELWGILDGLTILNEQRYERVLIHTNSLKSLKIGNRRMQIQPWFVSKKNNRVADGIAKLIFDNK